MASNPYQDFGELPSYTTEGFSIPGIGNDQLYLSLDMLDQYQKVYGDIMLPEHTEGYELPDYDKTQENYKRDILRQQSVDFGANVANITAGASSGRTKSLKSIGKSGIRSGSHVKGLGAQKEQMMEDIMGLRSSFGAQKEQAISDIAGIRAGHRDQIISIYDMYVQDLGADVETLDVGDIYQCLNQGGTWNGERCVGV